MILSNVLRLIHLISIFPWLQGNRFEMGQTGNGVEGREEGDDAVTREEGQK